MNRPMLKFPVSATALFVRNTINLHFESLHMLSRCRRWNPWRFWWFAMEKSAVPTFCTSDEKDTWWWIWLVHRLWLSRLFTLMQKWLPGRRSLTVVRCSRHANNTTSNSDFMVVQLTIVLPKRYQTVISWLILKWLINLPSYYPSLAFSSWWIPCSVSTNRAFSSVMSLLLMVQKSGG